jgi:hypothetical protein
MEWSRASRGDGSHAREVLSFQKIKNVGKGVALHVYLQCFHTVQDEPTAVLSTVRLPIIAANEEVQVDGEITLLWKNVDEHSAGSKFLGINLKILCWDSHGMRYETNYDLMAVELSANATVSDQIAPGVGLGTRHTIVRSGRRLRLRGRLQRIPLLRRAFRE